MTGMVRLAIAIFLTYLAVAMPLTVIPPYVTSWPGYSTFLAGVSSDAHSSDPLPRRTILRPSWRRPFHASRLAALCHRVLPLCPVSYPGAFIDLSLLPADFGAAHDRRR
ncbi:MAG: hypothetical protein AAYR33_03940 [Acetobacteraceae bacterium]